MAEKLVRDRIPEIIRSETGQNPNYRFAVSQEFDRLLFQKLREELTELGDSLDEGSPEKVIDELADVSEVLLAIGVEATPQSTIVEGRRREKKQDRGGFEEGIVMEFRS